MANEPNDEVSELTHVLATAMLFAEMQKRGWESSFNIGMHHMWDRFINSLPKEYKETSYDYLLLTTFFQADGNMKKVVDLIARGFQATMPEMATAMIARAQQRAAAGIEDFAAGEAMVAAAAKG